jgi:hypothetical protein
MTDTVNVLTTIRGRDTRVASVGNEVAEIIEARDLALEMIEEAAADVDGAAALLEAAIYSVTRTFTTDADEDDGRGPYALAYDPVLAEHLQVFLNGRLVLPDEDFEVVAMEGSPSGAGLKFSDDLTLPSGHTVAYTLNRFQPNAVVKSVLDFGAVVGTDCTEAFQAASDWSLEHGCPDILLPVSTLPYLVSDTFVAHCDFKADGSYQVGQSETGVGAVIQTTGAGTSRKWRDVVDGDDAMNFETPIVVYGRNGIEFSGIHFETGVSGAPRWTRAILIPGTRKCGVTEISTEGFTREAVVFDQTWSELNTALTALHPEIVPDMGCNECFVFRSDIRSYQSAGIGIIGSSREEASEVGSVWGPGGASGFRMEATRTTGLTLDARCVNAAGAVQNLTFDTSELRAGSGTETVLHLGHVNRVSFENSYIEGNAGEGTKVQFNEAANVTMHSVAAANVDLWHFDDNLSPLNNGNGGLAQLDYTNRDGTRWNRDGFVFTPTMLRPATNRGASVGSADYHLNAARAINFRSRHAAKRADGSEDTLPPEVFVRAQARTPGQGGRVYFQAGNSRIRMDLAPDSLELFANRLNPAAVLEDDADDADDADDEVVDADQGWRFEPFSLYPRKDGANNIGSSTKNLVNLWVSRLRSSTTLSLEATEGITTTSPLFAVDTAQASRTFPTRAAMIAKATALDALPEGSIVYAAGWGYQRKDAYTAITDFPGWRPLWAVTPFHFGAGGGTAAEAEARTLPDDTVAINRWLAAPDSYLTVPEAFFRITSDLYSKVDGRTIKGAGGGTLDQNGWNRLHGVRSAFVVDRNTTITKRRRTRRLSPETDLDADDDPISVMFDNQGNSCTFEDFAMIADCDYDDTTVGNYGADVDVGFFSGCRGQVTVNITTGGQFRIANVYFDVTGSITLPAMTAPDGTDYPGYEVNGADQCAFGGHHHGGRKQVAQVGATNSPSGDYYDFVSDTIVTDDDRGGSGGSDFRLLPGINLRGPYAPDGRRLYDPTMDPATEDFWLLPACVYISGRRGSDTQGRIRRAIAKDMRCVTKDACAVAWENVSGADFQNINIENFGDYLDSTGSAITITSTGGTANSYGALLCRPESGVDTGVVDSQWTASPDGVQARAPWTTDGCPSLKIGQGLIVQSDLDLLQESIEARAPGAVVTNIADDNVLEVTFDGSVFTGTFQFSMGSTSTQNTAAMGSFRAASSNNYVKVLTSIVQTSPAGVAIDLLTDTALTGTTGTDGRITLSTRDKKFFVENRTGASRAISINFNNMG